MGASIDAPRVPAMPTGKKCHAPKPEISFEELKNRKGSLVAPPKTVRTDPGPPHPQHFYCPVGFLEISPEKKEFADHDKRNK